MGGVRMVKWLRLGSAAGMGLQPNERVESWNPRRHFSPESIPGSESLALHAPLSGENTTPKR